MSARNKRVSPHIELPLPPNKTQDMEMEIYVRFMRHVRAVPNSKKEIKILSAIQFTADMTDNSDAHVAKVLVELGLRAPRLAFPATFLGHIDQQNIRSGTSYMSTSDSYEALQKYWCDNDEDKFAYLRRDFAWRESPLVRESA